MKAAPLHVAAGYGVAIVVIAAPFSEVLLTILPLNFGASAWRLAAITVMSQGLLMSLIGMLLMSAIAVYLEQRRMLLGLAIVLLAASVILLISAVSLVLDALEMRRQVAPENYHPYDMANLGVLIKLLMSSVVSGMLGLGSKKSADFLSRTVKKQPDATLVRPADYRREPLDS
jgi:hypothetical protein